jgi:HPt (histidine-containing phosphotransfer) domain-containing protein
MEPLSEEAILRLRRLGGPAFLGKMIDLFIAFGADKIKEATDAFQRQDFDAVGKAAHALKSSAANVGALQVQQLASAIEERAGSGTELGGSVAELAAAFQVVRPLLEAKRRGAASGSSDPE